jgi:hypothetical protein
VPPLSFLERPLAPRRLERLRAAAVSPGPFQAWILHRLLRAASRTPFGLAHGLCPEIGLDGYRDAVPIDARAAFAPRPRPDPEPGRASSDADGDDRRVAAYVVPWAGVLAVADEPGALDLVPVLDADFFFEFVPAAQAGTHASRLPLVAVEAGSVYAIAVTTDGGVWSRLTGDLVRITRVRPYRFRLVGTLASYARDCPPLCGTSRSA